MNTLNALPVSNHLCGMADVPSGLSGRNRFHTPKSFLMAQSCGRGSQLLNSPTRARALAPGAHSRYQIPVDKKGHSNQGRHAVLYVPVAAMNDLLLPRCPAAAAVQDGHLLLLLLPPPAAAAAECSLLLPFCRSSRCCLLLPAAAAAASHFQLQLQPFYSAWWFTPLDSAALL